MENPYELVKNVLLAEDNTTVSGKFTSIDLYGTSVWENGLTDSGDSCFHLENESSQPDHAEQLGVFRRILIKCYIFNTWRFSAKTPAFSEFL